MAELDGLIAEAPPCSEMDDDTYHQMNCAPLDTPSLVLVACCTSYSSADLMDRVMHETLRSGTIKYALSTQNLRHEKDASNYVPV